MTRRRPAVRAGASLVALFGCSRPAPAPQPAHFVGAARCAPCHAREAAAWVGSHHQAAMQPASAATVLGDFAGSRFDHRGVSSRFSRTGAGYTARTEGADGASHDYRVGYTFGVAPLQQYLVPLPGGRLQALEVAWDSRPASAGGQRWFHLYPDETIQPADPLHWTARGENWNGMCADCHSTNVRKGFDEKSGGYQTTFSELSVSCEACHGPGSRHVAWASAPASAAGDPGHGLLIALDERRGVSWTRSPRTGEPHRSAPRASAREIEMCARCHSRRGVVHEDEVHGQPLGDDYRVALLDDDLYYPDGQVKGEVYEYGSFVQSRMFAEGVTCSDCHDPHRPALAAFGDSVCLRCHAAETHATAAHHHHPAGSAGARCVACHMPPKLFMVVDARHDHSLRIPRPDLSVELGVPNPCNGCHAERSASWAARTVQRWYGHTPQGLQRFAAVLAAGDPPALAALAADASQPAIARATALARLPPGLPATVAVAGRALSDRDALLRRAAVEALSGADPGDRGRLLGPALADPVRTVRIEAATATAGLPDGLFSPDQRSRRATATGEFIAAQRLNADQPEAHLALASLFMRQGREQDAEAELRHALAIAPSFAPAAANLADLYRVLGRDADGERVLRQALARLPNDAGLCHALGLALVREGRIGEALPWLQRAAAGGPSEPRYGYVYAIALHDTGRRRESLRELEEVLRRRPGDRPTLEALASFYGEAGDAAQARRYGRLRAALDRAPAAN
jgi:Flp pilus assembly protein TadD